jgi:uncharacterized protein YndB with AHSA1/START domain
MPAASKPTLTVTMPSDREVRMTRVVNAPRSLVFEAWTSCEHLPNWLTGAPGWSMQVCEIDLRPGGASRLGWRKADGAEMEIRGTYVEVVPPSRLVQTESWGDPWPETRNTIEFTEAGGGTLVTLTMAYPSKEARDAAMKTGATEGMSLGFDRLDEYLRSR